MRDQAQGLLGRSVGRSVGRIGEGVKGQYLATLEDLATKRRELTTVIVALAAIQDVDPAPYLDLPPALTAADVEFVIHNPKAIAKKDPPARPQRPASRTTNGAGPDKVLEVLRSRPGPMKPADLAGALNWEIQKMRKHIKPLIASGQVKAAGKTSSRTYALA